MSRLSKYWPVALLALWLGAMIGLQLLHYDPYGLDENAAHALLLNWSVSESQATPVVAFQAPDFRSLLFAPLGMYWPGSFVAVKVFAAILAFAALALLFNHGARETSSEAALLGVGLLAIAPITLQQINSLGAGIFLLLCFAVGIWIDHRYRAGQKQLAGWFFAQLLVVATAVSLHPAGLGYSLALAYHWQRNPLDRRHQKQMWIGIGVASIVVILIRLGWHNFEWFNDPLLSLSGILFPEPPDAPIGPTDSEGALPAVLLILALVAGWRRLTSDLLGLALLGGLVIGGTAADSAWALLACAVILLFGLPALIDLNARTRAGSFVGQRGIVLAVVFVLATLFMIGDKIHRAAWQRMALSSHDHLISLLVDDVAGKTDQRIYIASQWPSRTMLATKQPTFPLRPVPQDRQEFLKQIKGITYFIFDPFDARNRDLSLALSELNVEFETFAVEERGVIVKARAVPAAPTEATDKPSS